jgi:sugar/nucleoside kinase (ribokinase family)
VSNSAARDLDLLIIGDCNPDVMVVGGDVMPAFGQQEKLVDSMSLEVGGSASIMAIAAARLGLRVALVAAIGADAAAEFMLGRLAAEGVDTSGMVIRPDWPTAMTVVLSGGSDRAILTAVGAMPMLTVADVPAGLLARARLVHVSAYFLLAGSLGRGLADVFAAARAGGALTSLDTNWDPAGGWGDAQLGAVLANTDVLMPNEAEALALSKRADILDAVAVLAGYGPRLVVKLGSRGALAVEGARCELVGLPRGLTGSYVDATGAGDCCDAGVTAGLLRDLDLTSAAALGCAVGSASTRAAGGTGARVDLTAALALAETVPVEPANTAATRATLAHGGRVPVL